MNINLNKLSRKDIPTSIYLLSILAVLSAGCYQLFIVDSELYTQLNIFKLLLLSIALTFPSFILISLFIIYTLNYLLANDPETQSYSNKKKTKTFFNLFAISFGFSAAVTPVIIVGSIFVFHDKDHSWHSIIFSSSIDDYNNIFLQLSSVNISGSISFILISLLSIVIYRWPNWFFPFLKKIKSTYARLISRFKKST